jgi:hypothetical protein
MDLIATRSFRNVPFKDFGRITVPNALHDDHVHKGAIFEIGTAETLKGLAKEDQKAAELTARLLMAKCVEPATPETIARVSAELEQDRVRAERVAQANAAATLQGIGFRFHQLVAQLSLSSGQAQPAPATRR